MQTPAGKVEHLYVHVPFCAAKCNYCAFYSQPGSAEQMIRYVDAVTRELTRFAPQLAPTTIFFGGGTPTVLPTALMSRLLEAVGRAQWPHRAAVEDDGGQPARPTNDKGGTDVPACEWTVEANPATVDAEKMRIMRDAGVNRISLGVQSFDDALLKTIGRVHSAKQAVETYELLRKSGFENINLDLMFGLPGQTMKHWCATLRRAIEFQPEHLSTYCLILEKDTEFWRLYAGDAAGAGHARLSAKPRAVPLPDDDEQLAMYETAIEMLEAAGYRQYEVSNFARPGSECVHNIAYWKVKDYIGLGPSACSTVGFRRWQNVSDTDSYIAALKNGADTSPLDYTEQLTPELRVAERAAFGMRMNAGVPADLVRGRWDKEIAVLLSAGLAQWRDGRLQPTRRGILFADEVAAEFL